MSTDTPHYAGHRARLRERLLKDSTALADYEILELLLGYALLRRDTKPLAKELLSRFGACWTHCPPRCSKWTAWVKVSRPFGSCFGK